MRTCSTTRITALIITAILANFTPVSLAQANTTETNNIGNEYDGVAVNFRPHANNDSYLSISSGRTIIETNNSPQNQTFTLNYEQQKQAYTFSNYSINPQNPYYLCAFDNGNVGLYLDTDLDTCFWQIERLNQQDLFADRVIIKNQSFSDQVLEIKDDNFNIGKKVAIGTKNPESLTQQSWNIFRLDKQNFSNARIRTFISSDTSFYLQTSNTGSASLRQRSTDVGQVFNLAWLQSYGGYLISTRRSPNGPLSTVCRQGATIREFSPWPTTYRNDCIWNLELLRQEDSLYYITSSIDRNNVVDVSNSPSPPRPGSLVQMFPRRNNPATANQMWQIIQ